MKKKSPARKIFSYFVQGLLALLPLIITGYVIKILFAIVERSVEDAILLIPLKYREIAHIKVFVKIGAAVLLFLFIIFFGMLIKTIIGRSIIKLFDTAFGSLPLIKTVYNASRQVIKIFSNKDETLFMQPVIIEYPSPGIWSIGFNTGMADKTLSPSPGGDTKYYTVFIPTTPNPTSGWLCILPENKITPLSISTEEAIKLILTGGAAKSETIASS